METLIRRRIPWTDLESLQAELVERVTKDPRESFLLVSEPLPTFTYGLSAEPGELLWEQPSSKGVDVHSVSRGGRWTYHGPGQIVVYPIAFLPTLGYPKRAAKIFVSDLASAVQGFLTSLDLPSEVHDKPYGVYLKTGKVASFGISLRNGVSSHGVALYLRSQHEFFDGIVPCGMKNMSITSLEDQGLHLEWETAASSLTDYIKRGFQASKN